MSLVCHETLMVIEALLRPKREVVMDVFTCFVHGPTEDIHHADAIPGSQPIWNKAADTAVDLSWYEEHHRMAFHELTHSHTTYILINFLSIMQLMNIHCASL